jgi:predicted PhzF superfamily epimerase YddE/YHI9
MLAAVSRLHVLRVFTDEHGRQGNPLGVFLQGWEVPAPERQGVAHELGFSETVFVDDAGRGEVRIFTPATELPFAGHPTVGTAWLLAREREPLDVLRPPAGELSVRHQGEPGTEEALTHVTGRPGWSPKMDYVEYPSRFEIEALAIGDLGTEAYAWAWIDEAAGTVRARGFFPGFGIPEDEATGSAALALCARLGRSIEVHQGRGSRISARPLADGLVEIGGRVVLDEVRMR